MGCSGNELHYGFVNYKNSGQVFEIVKFAIIEKWCPSRKSFRQQKVFYYFQSLKELFPYL